MTIMCYTSAGHVEENRDGTISGGWVSCTVDGFCPASALLDMIPKTSCIYHCTPAIKEHFTAGNYLTKSAHA